MLDSAVTLTLTGPGVTLAQCLLAVVLAVVLAAVLARWTDHDSGSGGEEEEGTLRAIDMTDLVAGDTLAQCCSAPTDGV